MPARKEWDWSPQQLKRLSELVHELLRRPEIRSQKEIARLIGQDDGKVSLAKSGSPQVSVPTARAICHVYDPTKTLEQLLGPGIPRRSTPMPFRAIRSEIRAGVVTGPEAMRAAILVAQEEPWWCDDAELLAASFVKRHPERTASMTAGAWIKKLREFSDLLNNATN